MSTKAACALVLLMVAASSVVFYRMQRDNYAVRSLPKQPPPAPSSPCPAAPTPQPASVAPPVESCRHVQAFYNDSEMKGAGFNASLPKADLCLPQPRYLPLPPDNQYNCSLPYVTIHSAGRLGNKITEYLSLALLRKVFGVRAAIGKDMNASLIPIFPKLSLPVADSKCFPQYTQHNSFANVYKKLAAASPGSGRPLYDTQLHPYPLNKSVNVNDFPCPVHILITIRDQFRQELAFADHILNKAKTQVDNALKGLNITTERNFTLVTVHVRRTDYLVHVKNYYHQNPVKDIYYQRAFNFYRNRTKNPVFLVTSDDPEWCKKNFKDKDIVYAGGKDHVVDLAVQSLGDHHVITDGTYGFCGAFLGRGIIVYPHPTGWPIYPCFKTPLLHPISRS